MFQIHGLLVCNYHISLGYFQILEFFSLLLLFAVVEFWSTFACQAVAIRSISQLLVSVNGFSYVHSWLYELMNIEEQSNDFSVM